MCAEPQRCSWSLLVPHGSCSFCSWSDAHTWLSKRPCGLSQSRHVRASVSPAAQHSAVGPPPLCATSTHLLVGGGHRACLSGSLTGLDCGARVQVGCAEVLKLLWVDFAERWTGKYPQRPGPWWRLLSALEDFRLLYLTSQSRAMFRAQQAQCAPASPSLCSP